jgi:hypothetical protein
MMAGQDTNPIFGVWSPCRPELGWPAAVRLFGFSWLELVQPDRTTLPALRLWALAWLVI